MFQTSISFLYLVGVGTARINGSFASLVSMLGGCFSLELSHILKRSVTELGSSISALRAP